MQLKKQPFSLTTLLPGTKLFSDDLDSVILLKKLASLKSHSCLKLFTIYSCQKGKKTPDINYIFKFTMIYSGAFITNENVLTKLTYK